MGCVDGDSAGELLESKTQLRPGLMDRPLPRRITVEIRIRREFVLCGSFYLSGY